MIGGRIAARDVEDRSLVLKEADEDVPECWARRGLRVPAVGGMALVVAMFEHGLHPPSKCIDQAKKLAIPSN